MSMTSVERVRRAIEFRDPDRVPIVFWNCDQTEGDVLLYHLALGVPGDGTVNAWDWSANEWEYRLVKSGDGTMGHPVDPVYRHLPRADEIRVPALREDERMSGVPAFLAACGNRYRLASFDLSGFTVYTFLRGFENAMQDFLLEPAGFAMLMDAIVDFECDLMRMAARHGFHGIHFADDWGTQSGMMISPALWRQLFKPRYARQFALAHQLGLDTWYHCCGEFLPIMEDYHEIGADVLNIAQPNVNDIAEIGRRLRGRQCFLMPISYQTVSITGTPDQIYAEAERLHQLLCTPAGGFIGYVEQYRVMGMSDRNYRACGEAFRWLSCRSSTARPSAASPRQRVLAALRHEVPDRTPRDFWAEPATMNRLFAHVGHRNKDRLLDALGVDIRHLETSESPPRALGDGLYQNFWGEQYLLHETPWGPMREDTKGALADARHFAELESFPWPTPDCLDRSQLTAQCARYDDYALLYGFADIWQRPALVRGWEEMLIDMAERPEWVHFLCRQFTDFYREDYTRAAEITRGRIDLYLVISDLGTQRGPLISMAMFREFVAPYLKEMTGLIHQLGGRVLFHSCGTIWPFIPELIACGVDVLDPIQPTCPEMSPEHLHRQFGSRLCFHGGIDMQDLLPNATPAQVEAEVRRYCDVFARGGYILGPAHLFQPDVPPENILAVYRSAT